MARGCINLGTSRRTCHNKTFYWKRNEDDEFDESMYEHNVEYDGVFYAKDVRAKASSKQDISGMFLFDSNVITIMTYDKVDIKSGDVVKYDNQIWKVEDVQERDINKNNEFMKEPDKETYINLKR